MYTPLTSKSSDKLAPLKQNNNTNNEMVEKNTDDQKSKKNHIYLTKLI
jgi:hypothetical protein